MPTSIRVNRSPIPDQLWSASRHICVAIGAWLVGKGYLEADTASAIGTVLMVAVPIIFSQLKVRRRALELATVAASPHVPDSVASLKP